LTNEKHAISLPSSDVLQFYTADGSKISVRPSGTEPKIKFYVSVKSVLKSKSDFERASNELGAKIKMIEKDLVA
jgi:phosphoglucomutase